MSDVPKAIPAGRDRLQSQLLVAVLGLPIIVISLLLLLALFKSNPDSQLYLVESLGISLTFGVVVWALRSATFPAAVMGTAICLIVTLASGTSKTNPLRSGLGPLMALFVLTFAATRLGRRKKESRGLAESRKGRRASQVIANLGPAVVVLVACAMGWFNRLSHVSGIISFSTHVMPAALLATLCAATADTVSSEIGQAFGGRPYMLTSFRAAEPGTDGAVTLVGTGAGVVGAAIVAAVGWGYLAGTPLIGISGRQVGVALAAGVFGLLFDSLLGATVERQGWLGNDLVNFASTLMAGVVAVILLAI